MNNSDGIFTMHGKGEIGTDIKCNMQDKKHDLLHHFKQSPKYAWYFANINA